MFNCDSYAQVIEKKTTLIANLELSYDEKSIIIISKHICKVDTTIIKILFPSLSYKKEYTINNSFKLLK